MSAVDQRGVARFRADWARLTTSAGGPVLIAFSGGPDSTALLLLAQAAFGSAVYAVTVDHALRPESAQEADQAAAICAERNIAHTTLTAGPITAGNLQARAREARYALLNAHADAIGARWIATAHHADDQLETMLMRLNRGSGVAGLAAIRALDGRIVRPLLGWRRSELAAIVELAGVDPVTDASNGDSRFDRARLRKRLCDVDWLDPLAAANSAAALQEAEAALAWMVDRLAAERIRHTAAGAVLDPRDLPAELRRRLTLRCLIDLDPGARPRGEALTRLIARLEAGGQAVLGSLLVACEGADWAFRPAPPRRAH